MLFNNRTFNIENVETVVDRRVLLVDAEKYGSKFRIINVYGYTDKKQRTTLQPFLCSRRNIVWGGDFNYILGKKVRRGENPVGRGDVPVR